MLDLLLNVAVPQPVTPTSLPDDRFVEKSKLTKDLAGYGPYYSQWRSSTINETPVDVLDIIVISGDNVSRYDAALSLNDCRAQEGSWFFDQTPQRLFIHLEHTLSRYNFSILQGTPVGFSKDSAFIISNTQYEPRLRSVPTIQKTADAVDNSKMTFNAQRVTLDNGDGALDAFFDNPIPGSLATLAIWDTDTQTGTDVFSGTVSRDLSTLDQITFSLEDIRSGETTKIPETRINDTDWPDAEDDVLGELIPEGYGTVIDTRCICVNGNDAVSDKVFLFATDATAVGTVLVNIDDVWTAVTPVSTDPGNGTFTLSNADAVDAGAIREVVATVTLRAQTNPGDIIADMNSRYNNIEFISTNYDLTEWAAEAAKLADIGFIMDDGKELFEWFEIIQNSTDFPFIYDIDGSGLRTIRVNDPDRPVARFISRAEIKNDLIPAERDFNLYASRVEVAYNQNLRTEIYEREVFNDYENLTRVVYGRTITQEYETLLTDAIDAANRAELIGEDYRSVNPIFTVQLHVQSPDDIDLKLFDFVDVDTAYPGETFPSVPDILIIDSAAPDTLVIDPGATDTIVIDESIQLIVNAPGRRYWGVRRCQVLGFKYAPDTLTYELTLRERNTTAGAFVFGGGL